jgi:uncharacterized SAM-binding protein YcdF (DUF218 family)
MLAWICLAALSLAVVTTLALLRAGRPKGVWWIAWLVPAMALGAVAVVALKDLETQKLLSRMAMPLGVVWVATFVLGWWWLLGRRWGPGILTMGVFLLLTGVGNSWLGALALRWQQQRATCTDPTQAKAMDAVFCLGGGTKVADGIPMLGASGDRLLLTVRLWRLRLAPLLVASGASVAGMDQARDLAAETATLWQTMGVPAPYIIRLAGPRTTSEEIRRYAEECRSRGWKSVGIVTSAWHVPRAQALAHREGLSNLVEIQWFGADAAGAVPPWSAVWVVPGPDGALSMQWALWEVGGMLVGR